MLSLRAGVKPACEMVGDKTGVFLNSTHHLLVIGVECLLSEREFFWPLGLEDFYQLGKLKENRKKTGFNLFFLFHGMQLFSLKKRFPFLFFLG